MTLPTASIEQYEALRQNALEPGRIFSVVPLGAVLVVKNGMAGWMRRWSQVGDPAAPAASLPLHPAGDEAGWQRELTVLLAEMTATHLPSIGS